jgi:uncharacterized membrane protein
MAGTTENPGGWRHAAARPFRRAVLRGLAVLCPPLLTVLIVVWAINTTKSYFLEPVTNWARDGLVWYLADIREDLPLKDRAARTAEYHGREYQELDNGAFIPRDVYETVRRQTGEALPATAEGFYRRYVDLTYLQPYLAIPVFLAVFVMLLYLLGKFIALGFGDFSAHIVERIFSRVPGVRAVYSAVKQVTDFVFTERELKVTRIVAVEFPRKGVWSVGFVTGESFAAIRDVAAEPVLTVLLPYSPLPVTGCTIMVRKSECIDLNITFEQACQFIVSCGVVVPPTKGLGIGDGGRGKTDLSALRPAPPIPDP